MEEYIKSNLQDIQNLYYKRFEEVHKFMEDNNINYFAIGGTLLGAVRHKGFIPWDNDMDIGMLREDYEKFISLCHNLNPEHFIVDGCKVNKKSVAHGLTKICLLGTKQEINQKERFDNHFHIDVFPFDSVPSDKKEQKKNAKKRQSYIKLLYYKSRQTANGFVKKVALKMVQFFLLPYTSYRVACNYDKFAKRCTERNKECEKITNLMGVYSYERESVPKNYIGNRVLLQFGPTQIRCPENYDGYLKQVYGENYMTPADVRFDVNEFFCYIRKDFLSNN